MPAVRILRGCEIDGEMLDGSCFEELLKPIASDLLSISKRESACITGSQDADVIAEDGAVEGERESLPTGERISFVDFGLS